MTASCLDWQEAVSEAAKSYAELRSFLFAWDHLVADAAALAGDAETMAATLPF